MIHISYSKTKHNQVPSICKLLREKIVKSLIFRSVATYFLYFYFELLLLSNSDPLEYHS